MVTQSQLDALDGWFLYTHSELWIVWNTTMNKCLGEWARDLKRRKTIINIENLFVWDLQVREGELYADKGRRDQWKVNLIVIPKTWKISFSFICNFDHCRHIGDNKVKNWIIYSKESFNLYLYGLTLKLIIHEYKLNKITSKF